MSTTFRDRLRPFPAIPLGELAPDLVLPGSGQRVWELAAGMPRERMRALPRYTALLREDVSLIPGPETGVSS